MDEGGPPWENLKELDRETQRKIRGWIEQWRLEEDRKLEPVWKEFRRTLKDQVSKALNLVFERSDQMWYAADSGAIAVPTQLLRRETEVLLPDVLGEKIQFKDMLQETRQALAEYAVARSFDDVLHEAQKSHRHFTIGGRAAPVVVADLIPRDFYHLGAREPASRLDMAILTAFDNPMHVYSEKEKKHHQPEKDAIKRWSHAKSDRPDDRRFTGTGWERLDQNFKPERDLLAMTHP